MKLQPLNDRVLVKRLETEEKTAGGLYIPDTAKEKPCKGQVIATGPGKVLENGTRVELAVKKGDQVLFNKYAGTEVKLDGIDHALSRQGIARTNIIVKYNDFILGRLIFTIE